MHLIITIDTEEDFNWKDPFSRHQFSVQSLAAHHDIMMGFYTKMDIKPVMVLSYPIIDHSQSCDYIQDYVRKDLAYIGAHLHPWVTPPFTEALNNFNSYPGNLSPDIEYQKLKILTDIIQRKLSITPKFYKAGRYGFGPNTDDILGRLGYKYDLSLSPGRDCSYDGGFDHRYIWPHPFTSKNNVSYIPVTSGFIGALSDVYPVQKICLSRCAKSLKVKSALSRSHLCKHITLTPENMPLHAMKALTVQQQKQGQKIFHLTFHSSIFQSGDIPYPQSPNDVEKLIAKIKNYLMFFKEQGGKFWREGV